MRGARFLADAARICTACSALLCVPAAALAQAYPERPVNFVIAYPPGSGADIVARIVSQKLSELWGKPVVDENRPGAGGSLAASAVARAAPDGYTLLVDANSHVVTPYMYAKLPYDVLRDFIDVAGLAIQPNVLVVPAAGPYHSLMDLVNAAKAKPGAINFASAGIGSGTHLALERFIAAASIQVTHIPFKGTAEVVTGLLNGSVDCYWGPVSAVVAQVRSGKLRALAVDAAKRNPQLPDVPTTGEAGVAGAESPIWWGLWAPAGTPAPIIEKIAADVHRALESPDVRARFTNLGSDILDLPQKEFAAYVRDEYKNYAKVVAAAGIKPQ
jgi:tripartite-type tricarboxylate transporter receptor subunit TctC